MSDVNFPEPDQNKFELQSEMIPRGDQPEAIRKLVSGLKRGLQAQTLLGVTGSGKTYTMAKVIEETQRPALVIAHNKTLAGQLAAEFTALFPDNAVEYFVSYYDYYQPEAYIPSRDIYIEKDSAINDEIDRLRHKTTSSLLERRDVIVVASVSCIYGLGDPDDYKNMMIALRPGMRVDRDEIIVELIRIQYQRNDYEAKRGTFRVRGDTLDIYPSSAESSLTRVVFFGDEIEEIREVDAITGRTITGRSYVAIFPASHYTTTEAKMKKAAVSIQQELEERLEELQSQGKLLEAYRLEQRTRYDLEMLAETGFCKGIENYSRHMTGRQPGDPPYTLLDFFPDDYLLFIDESHVTIPQIGAMYHGDRSRKESLVDYGFRLPSAFDNRPLRFEEFEQRMGQSIFVSATPSRYEAEHSEQVVEQVIRPTGLVDPEIVIHPIDGQIDDLIDRIRSRIAAGERSLVLTLTKRMAEDMTDFLKEEGLAVEYLHSDIATVERLNILKRLRRGEFDVLVGINLLREGLDLPEVSLIAILDADREGFLRSTTSLIQIIGRAARNVNGQVVLYADTITKSMDQAIEETNRRREIQTAYNKEHNIIPRTIKKDVYELHDTIVELVGEEEASVIDDQESFEEKIASYEREDLRRLEKNLQKAMQDFANELEFEEAARMRDRLISVRGLLAGRNRF
ncbi:MAG: excinuclease ABC subunit UvrB [Eubacteriales bacterium]|nr:excinuclease ABC subunit UvrB [Eubacteriales bacterium]MDD4540678.1 excinuclease ABC subunit UvrB [Eubacteriales bacterium]